MRKFAVQAQLAATVREVIYKIVDESLFAKPYVTAKGAHVLAQFARLSQKPRNTDCAPGAGGDRLDSGSC